MNNKFKKVAIEAALTAGAYLKSKFGKKHTISYKGKIDLLTEVDKKSESIISKIILKNFPDHSLVCEEGTCVESKSGYKWFVDPLDGTTNFAHNFPVFAVSIGLQKDKEMISGAVYAPVLNEFFWAVKGRGAHIWERKIHVSKIKKLEKSLLATGFPYLIKDKPSDKIFNKFKEFTFTSQAVRRAGAASYDLCCVAAGRFDGFWEEDLHAWDISAGIIILKEAGGVSTDFKGKPVNVYGRQILATNGFIHKEMLKIVK